MIELWSGKPGSGKSLDASRLILDYLQYKKLPVICNFQINPDVKGYKFFHYVPNAKLTPDYLVRAARAYWRGREVKEESILLVVDECQLLFNSRDWNKKDGNGVSRMDWIEFFSQHRHYGYKCIFIAQSAKMVDRQIRDGLFEYEVVHRKISNLGFKGRVISLLLGGNVFSAITYYYGTKERITSRLFHGRKRYYRLYDSFGAIFSQV